MTEREAVDAAVQIGSEEWAHANWREDERRFVARHAFRMAVRECYRITTGYPWSKPSIIRAAFRSTFPEAFEESEE